MKRFIVCITLLSFIANRSFSQNPVAQDKKWGEEGAAMVATQYGIYNHQVTQNYIEQLGNKIAAQIEADLPFKFSFQLVNMVEPNAFSLPGGYVYVSRGLLPMLNSEDELACILGHEIAHIVRRHSAQQMKKSIVPTLFTLPGLLVGGIISPELGAIINAPINAAGSIYLAKYSRGQEDEADEIGALLAAKAGYDPRALGKALDQIEKTVELYTGEKSRKSIFDDHPYTPERVANIKKLSEKIHAKEGSPIAKNSSEFNHYMYGIHLQDDPEQGIFQEQNFIHPGLRFKFTLPDDWQTVNTPTAVGGTNKDQTAMLVLGAPDEGGNHTKLGSKFLEKSSKSKDVQILSSGETKFKGMPAFEVKFIQKGKRESTKGQLIWFSYQNLTFQFAGLWQGNQKDAIDNSINTFSGVSTQDLKDVKVLTLALEKSKSSESYEAFSERSGNVWNTGFLKVMNDLKTADVLPNDQELKIAIWTPLKY